MSSRLEQKFDYHQAPLVTDGKEDKNNDQSLDRSSKNSGTRWKQIDWEQRTDKSQVNDSAKPYHKSSVSS
jgi:hypothetical protein